MRSLRRVRLADTSLPNRKLMAEVIFDTNVPIVANGLAGQASEACVEACIDRLLQSRAQDVVLVDDGGLILEESQRYLAHRGQPGVGGRLLQVALGQSSERSSLSTRSDRGFNNPIRAVSWSSLTMLG